MRIPVKILREIVDMLDREDGAFNMTVESDGGNILLVKRHKVKSKHGLHDVVELDYKDFD